MDDPVIIRPWPGAGLRLQENCAHGLRCKPTGPNPWARCPSGIQVRLIHGLRILAVSPQKGLCIPKADMHIWNRICHAAKNARIPTPCPCRESSRVPKATAALSLREDQMPSPRVANIRYHSLKYDSRRSTSSLCKAGPPFSQHVPHRLHLLVICSPLSQSDHPDHAPISSDCQTKHPGTG
jgi:hypothetical protein